MLAKHPNSRVASPQRTWHCPQLSWWPVAAHAEATQRRRRTRTSAQRNEREPFDAFTARALQEACDLLARSQQLAQDQTRSELLQSMQAGGGGGAHSSSTGEGVAGMSQAAMESFWLEQGLTQRQAEQLSQQLCTQQQGQQEAEQRGTMPWTSSRLAAKLSTLQRVLPGVSIAHLVQREPALLDAEPASMVQALLDLLQAFPAGTNVAEMMAAQPRLLLTGDLGSRAARTLDKLLALHPSADRHVVAGIVEENPELLFRLPDYYQDAMLLDDLPIEVQNMMVHADQGIGWLHRYYRLKRQEAAADGHGASNNQPWAQEP